MILMDKLAYSSKLREKDPALKLMFALITLVICLWADSPVMSLWVAGVMAWMTVFKCGTSLPYYLKLMLIPGSFLVLSVLTIIISVTPEPQGLGALPFFSLYLSVTRQGLILALHLVLKALGAVACLYFLTLSTPMIEVLSVLRRWKIPKLMIELMDLIYRFIFILLDIMAAMLVARQARLGQGGFRAEIRSIAGIASSLFIHALKKSQDLFNAMESRGYDGEINVLEKEFRRSARDMGWLVGFESALLLAAVGIKWMGGGGL